MVPKAFRLLPTDSQRSWRWQSVACSCAHVPVGVGCFFHNCIANATQRALARAPAALQVPARCCVISSADCSSWPQNSTQDFQLAPGSRPIAEGLETWPKYAAATASRMRNFAHSRGLPLQDSSSGFATWQTRASPQQVPPWAPSMEALRHRPQRLLCFPEGTLEILQIASAFPGRSFLVVTSESGMTDVRRSSLPLVLNSAMGGTRGL